MDECRFCNYLKTSQDFIWENEFFFAKFDANPVSPGHGLLISKRHILNISDLEVNEKSDLVDSIEKLKEIILGTDLIKFYEEFPQPGKFINIAKENLKKNDTKISGFNIGINEGKSAGQTIMHLHIHIIPRFVGDLDDPIGGVRNTIPGMGNYKK